VIDEACGSNRVFSTAAVVLGHAPRPTRADESELLIGDQMHVAARSRCCTAQRTTCAVPALNTNRTRLLPFDPRDQRSRSKVEAAHNAGLY
jgi:hypothetical protein